MKRWIPWLALVIMNTGIGDGYAWEKRDAQGRPLAWQDGPWACILDRRNGLVWENKSDNEGLHYQASTYSWFDPALALGAAGKGGCVLGMDAIHPCDTAGLVADARAERWCGLDGWRLPSLAELKTLMYDTGYAGNPKIVTGFFPHTLMAPYWSATLRRSGQGEWQGGLVDFGSGHTLWLPLDRVARVRLVAPLKRR